MEYSTKSPIKAAILAAILLLLLTACGKIQLDYEQTVEPCSVMEFRVSNVRETPAALTGELDNALGVIEEDNFTMLIASGEVFKATDPMVPANGVFYGIKVDDIVATPPFWCRRWTSYPLLEGACGRLLVFRGLARENIHDIIDVLSRHKERSVILTSGNRPKSLVIYM